MWNSKLFTWNVQLAKHGVISLIDSTAHHEINKRQHHRILDNEQEQTTAMRLKSEHEVSIILSGPFLLRYEQRKRKLSFWKGKYLFVHERKIFRNIIDFFFAPIPNNLSQTEVPWALWWVKFDKKCKTVSSSILHALYCSGCLLIINFPPVPVVS